MILHLEDGGDDLPAECLELNAAGELPICSSTGDGGWDVSYPSDDVASTGGGIDGFAVLFVLSALGAIAVTVWKVSAARKMARRSGMDPNEATGMTLLTDDGFEATYLASSLRGEQATPGQYAAPTATPGTPADRLQALQDLKDRGLITDSEYAARRQAIIDTV